MRLSAQSSVPRRGGGGGIGTKGAKNPGGLCGECAAAWTWLALKYLCQRKGLCSCECTCIAFKILPLISPDNNIKKPSKRKLQMRDCNSVGKCILMSHPNSLAWLEKSLEEKYFFLLVEEWGAAHPVIALGFGAGKGAVVVASLAQIQARPPHVQPRSGGESRQPR